MYPSCCLAMNKTSLEQVCKPYKLQEYFERGLHLIFVAILNFALNIAGKKKLSGEKCGRTFSVSNLCYGLIALCVVEKSKNTT